MKRFALFCGAVLVALAVRAEPARADLRVCNRTSYIVYAAVGYESGTQMLTRGWTRVVPGDCATALEGSLDQPAYFLYARSSRAHAGPARAWGGRIRLCAKETDFAIDVPVGAARCGSDDAFLVPFASIPTGHKASWTTTLTGTPRFATAAEAHAAGAARLLSDIGYRVGLGVDAASDARALADFHARLRLPSRASDAALFDALETEAEKAAAPEGYSVCNDGLSELWAAIALRSPRISVARGWWDVPPGGCAKVLTTPLTFDTVYLLAETRANKRLVAGRTTFCVTNIMFEIFGTTGCTGRGLASAGFAATNTKGMPGFVAHIGNSGLLPATTKSRQAPLGR
ncbi:MAG TPA: DUF1036 domain-containing protein [Rhizomicrobium sp.]|jgi:uncharacterized membrane protein